MTLSVLITQCLQRDFVEPVDAFEPLPNALHVGRQEALRLMGLDPHLGPVAQIMGWARKQDPERKPLVKKYYMHGIGHHLGLDVHDVSPPDEPVRAGMVFTVEPGIYIREENLGVRLEDDILVGEHGNHNLLADIPIDPDEIEELMNR